MSEQKSVLDAVPAPLRPWIGRAVAWAKGLSRPARVLAASMTVFAIAIAGYAAFRSSNPPYAVLFANLDRDDASAVVAKLKEMKVPYRVEGEGSIIEVPESQARELRLELAGAGLPRGGAVGFESFDKMKLGATEFEQRVLYRRALEGELARTISTVGAVQSARVHLVLPEKSVFVSRSEPSSASIVLKLRGGRALGAGEVSGIVHLVSSSVAGLAPERVAIVTTEGTVLHKPRREGDDAMGDDERASQARSIEATLEERARGMVEKVVGPGRVDVRVTADVDTARTEHVEDHYDPRLTALRSEERSVERTSDEVPVAGVPGAESNLPTGSARGSSEADGGAPSFGAGAVRESHTRNFEVDHVSEKRVQIGGVLRRLTVAVVVDGAAHPGAPALDKEQMDKINALVRSAVGFDERRGDLVTVEAVPFLGVEKETPPAPSALPVDLDKMKKYWPVAAGAAALLFVTTVVLFIRRRRRKAKAMAEALAAAEVVPALGTAEFEALPEPEESAEDLRAKVLERVTRDPATAALVVRAWLAAAAAAEPKPETAEPAHDTSMRKAA